MSNSVSFVVLNAYFLIISSESVLKIGFSLSAIEK